MTDPACTACLDLGERGGCPACGRHWIGASVRALHNRADMLDRIADEAHAALGPNPTEAELDAEWLAANEADYARIDAEDAEERGMVVRGWDAERGEFTPTPPETELLALLREPTMRRLIEEAAEMGGHQGYGWLLAAMAGDKPDEFGAIEAAKAILDMLMDGEMEREGNQTIIEAAERIGVDIGWSTEPQQWCCVVCGDPTRDWDEEHRQAACWDCIAMW